MSDPGRPPAVLVAGDPGALPAVLDALAAGRVVAVPTDTVYGLAARVDRPGALAAVFAAKGRPADLSLPVLIGERSQVGAVAASWPRAASVLAARYWPGPLTLVVPGAPGLGPRLGGGDSVGVRLPSHPEVRELCRRAGPLAVTSANLHGHPPATTAAQVAATFNASAVAAVLDGGSCDGVPSTVVDCTTDPPACLRRGALEWSELEAALD